MTPTGEIPARAWVLTHGSPPPPALATGLACFAVPGWNELAHVLSNKPGGGDLRASAALSAGRLLAGTGTPALAVLFWLLAARRL